MPTLYLIPTPLTDDPVSATPNPQLADVVGRVDAYFVENLRSARRFISSLQTGRIIDQTTFHDLHKDTPFADTRRQFQELTEGRRHAAVLAEAGCPGVADPGSVAVGIAHSLGWRVEPLVGPSSLLLALMGSGLNGQSFVFHGYLPIDRRDRVRAIKFLETEAETRSQTQLFIETPYRNNPMLADLLATCKPQTRLCVACNLTAPDAYLRTMTIGDWKKQQPLIDLHKKPTVFLLL
jgi:16S rRNA (cytidine1402-2'-O)-methyltransferase